MLNTPAAPLVAVSNAPPAKEVTSPPILVKKERTCAFAREENKAIGMIDLMCILYRCWFIQDFVVNGVAIYRPRFNSELPSCASLLEPILVVGLCGVIRGNITSQIPTMIGGGFLLVFRHARALSLQSVSLPAVQGWGRNRVFLATQQ